MKAVLISYSLTGNNGALATRIANGLAIEHIRISEQRKRTIGKIALDVMFNRTPKITQTINSIEGIDLVILIGPVWMGQAPSPMRLYLKALRGRPCQYAFASISGGADGPNQNLAGDLIKWAGKAPMTLIDFHIADLLPSEPKPTREDTMAYKLGDDDVKRLADEAVGKLRAVMNEGCSDAR